MVIYSLLSESWIKYDTGYYDKCCLLLICMVIHAHETFTETGTLILAGMHVQWTFRKMLLTTASNVGWTFATVIKHFFRRKMECKRSVFAHYKCTHPCHYSTTIKLSGYTV